MRKFRSKSERDYTVAYEELRLGGGYFDTDKIYSMDDVTVDCAILSYDYHDSEFRGWINRHREATFWDGMVHRHPELVFPF